MTADVSECSTSTSEGSSVMQALLDGFDSFSGYACLEDGYHSYCPDMGTYLRYTLNIAGVSYDDLINELELLAPSSPVIEQLLLTFDSSSGYACLEDGGPICSEVGLYLYYSLNSAGCHTLIDE